MKKYDAIMIGFGKGSKTLAADLAKQGKKVAMIEKSNQMYGGTCINEGCIPSKSLIIQAGKFAYEEAIQNKEALIAKLRQKNYDKLDQLENVTIYTAMAEFVSDHEILVKNEEIEEVLYGDYIFINTGSTSIEPTIDGVKDTKHVLYSAQMIKQTTLPKRLAIIGGGYIGLEFSSMYARYGSEVHVFEHGDRLVKREDEDVAKAIQEVLEKQGVQFHFHVSVKAVHNEDEQVVVTCKDKDNKEISEMYDTVLLATGRKANTEALRLEKAGVDVDARGNVVVNEHLQTSVPHIYAMGDVKGGLQFTYISLDDYRIVKDHVLKEGKRTIYNRGNIAYSVFISPTFSRVGLSAQEAIEAGYSIKVAQLPAAAIPRANVDGQVEGMMKAIIDTKTDLLLGCVLFNAHSEEMINFIALAMDQGLPYQAIRDHVFTHPSMLEALNDLFAGV